MADYEQPPPERDRPSGCLDALVVTRAVFAILFWPLVALLAVILDVGVTFYLYSTHPALALIPIAVSAGALWLLARWEQRHFRPPGI